MIIGFLLFYLTLGLLTPHVNWLQTRSIENQIDHLTELLNAGYDDELQERYPEGKMFSNVLLGLSIIEYSEKLDNVPVKYSSHVDSCILRVLSPEAKAPFSASLLPKYGAFYSGWTHLLLSRYSQSRLYSKSQITSRVEQELHSLRNRLTEAFTERHPIPSYHGIYWPADNFVCLASLNETEIQSIGIDMFMGITEHPSGLIHHAGFDSTVVRGSSTSMITYFLGQMDEHSAQEYNRKFDSLFVRSFLWANLVKEHIDGAEFPDIDSGPLLFGYGASATLMNIKTQASLGQPGAKATWGWMNVIGVPINFWDEKYYLFNSEPMFDLFMLWAAVEL